MYASNRPPRTQALASPGEDLGRRLSSRSAFGGGICFDPRDAAVHLLRAQNSDGGWPYVSGQSWTEATALAILALRAASSSLSQCPHHSEWLAASRRGIDWLHGVARGDGGFAPSPAVAESTWVTSLALLALLSPTAEERYEDDPGDSKPADPLDPRGRSRRAIAWLLAQKSARTTGFVGFLQRLLNTPGSHPPPGGAPWYPGTAAWVAPTAWRVFALLRAAALTPDPAILHAIGQAREFLLLHRLDDGGWNHGGWYAPTEQVTSYPESTGLALMALCGIAPATLQKSINHAKSVFAQNPSSLEAWAWLKMSLVAHGQTIAKDSATPAGLPVWTVRDLALGLLAANVSSPDNVFTSVAAEAI